MKKLFACMLALLASMLHLPAAAEDIDLFASPPTTVTYLPNVLIIIDNTANWNSAFSNEKAALKAVFDSLPLDKFRVGVMLFSESGGGNGTPDGGYVRAAIRTMNAANRPVYSAWMNSLTNVGDRGNGRGLGLAMAEAYKYFAGQPAHAGHNKVKRDYPGNTASAAETDSLHALAGNAFASSTSSTYVSPVQDSCQRNFIIYIGNTTASGNVTKDNTSDNDQARTLLAAVGGDTTQVTDISPAGFSDNYSDEWSRFMKISTYGITTYTIDVSYGTGGNGPDNTGLLKSMANQGAGKYFRIEAGTTTTLQADIEKAMGLILSEIQSVNSVFASVSLPVSVNTQGSYLNQVYIGMFRPDLGAAPRWSGNLKQYKLGLVGGNLKLLDADAAPAINTQTGFITECARSFWTDRVVDSYFSFKGWPTGTTFCLPPSGTTAAQYRNSNWPDGNIVEKGAQAYRLRSTTTRSIYTCGSTMAGCTGSASMVAFSTTNVTATAIGATTAAERDALVNWARGLDTQDEDLDGVTTTQMRASAHGDIVHSRPVAVNFQADATTAATSKVVVFYGGNDGMLRAINGNRGDGVTAIGGKLPGEEMWSFMPPEAYANVKRLRDNTTLVKLASETYSTGVATGPKPYGMDGPITAFQGNVGSPAAAKTFIYATMRRGGRSIYAFDVTNMLTSPSSPTFKWRIGCSTPLGSLTPDCSADMDNMAQSWSSLKVFTTAGHGSGATNLLAMGGGYDTCEDFDGPLLTLLPAGRLGNHNCTLTSKGGSVYILDANDGTVVREFNTGKGRGIIADITLVRDASGRVILGYTADLGGNVYRIRFGSGAAASWTMTHIASLGCDTVALCDAPRKFMFGPSVVTTDTISVDATYTILLGSGDREKPISFYEVSNGVRNRFFQFRDKPNDSDFPGTEDCGVNLVCVASLYSVTGSASPTERQVMDKKGWALHLANTEQVVTSAVTVFGVTTFSTHRPATSTGTCTSNLGDTKVYNVDYRNVAPAIGDSRSADVAGDGLPPSPVAGQVTLDDGTTVPFCIGCSGESPLEGKLPPTLASTNKPKGRLYWFIEK